MLPLEAMTEAFIPDGYVTFKDAVEEAAKLLSTSNSNSELEIDKARAVLRRRLFSGQISSWLFESGHVRDFPVSNWGDDRAYDRIIQTGKGSISTGDIYSPSSSTGLVLLQIADLEGLLIEPTITRTMAKSSQPQSESLFADRGRGRGRGRPTKYPWDKIWVEICAMMHEGGLPESQAEMVMKVQAWFEIKYQCELETSTLRPKVAMLFERLDRLEKP